MHSPCKCLCKIRVSNMTSHICIHPQYSRLLCFLYFSPASNHTEDTGSSSTDRAKVEESAMDVDDAIGDPEFLQSVLENLPGVDPQAVDSLNKDKTNSKDKSNDK